jgi:putative transposase
MDENQQREVAIFRFGVISDMVSRTHMDRGEQEKLLEEKCQRKWKIAHSNRTRLGRSTLLGWIRAYRESGGRIESLYPKTRSDKGASRAIDEETGEILVRLRREMPRCPVTLLIAEMEKRKLIAPDTVLSPVSVYRFLKKEGLHRIGAPAPVDRRKFEAESPNDLWQSDVCHGPMVLSGDKSKKAYLLAFIDDMSRIIPHAAFYPSENLDTYLEALKCALLKRGLPRKLYVDNGPAFRSSLLEEICASLGIALVHSRPYKPQGRGKVERWFRTVRTRFLSTFKGNSLEELNYELEKWIREDYHNQPHNGTGEPPMKRFADHMECVRPAPKDLEDYFRKRARRRVMNDRTISLNGKLYEAPVALIGKYITVCYHDSDPARVEILLEGKSHGFLSPLDLHVNSRVRRNRHTLTVESTSSAPVRGGQLHFGPRKGEDES